MPGMREQCGVGLGIPTLSNAEFDQLRRLILDHTGISLRDNKRPLMVARLGQHVRRLGLESFADYYRYLIAHDSDEELTTFINRMTTNKTSFFREPHHFEFLRTRLIPEIAKKDTRRLRIWSCGCSSGEEPYTIAITVREALAHSYGWDVKILASDIDTEKLEEAASGVYSVDTLEDVSEERLRKNFLRGYGDWDGMVQVRPELRQMITFQRINLIEPSWPVRFQFDAIFCRNVIIYFEQPLQERIVQRLASHLVPRGYFFAGHSENLFWLRDVLASVAPTVYQLKKGDTKQ